MSVNYRPRRSVLYMPAANERALEKAKNLEADALIFDLEDAVSPENKELARDQACAAASSSEYGHRELTIRCNGLDTPWGTDDVLAAAAAAPAAVVIPKVDGPDYLDQVSTLLDKGGAPPSTRIWAMVETPSGILKVDQIAGHERIAVMVMGTNDMAKELRATITPNRHALLPYLAKCLLSARAADIGILDGVYNDINDETGFSSVCLQGAQMGFDGKTLIHPRQLAAANKIFAPSDGDIAEADIIVTAFEQAQAAGKGVVVVNGQLVENLHVAAARRLLDLANTIEARQNSAVT